jgi:TAG lipase/lysophosphatidylethanolamine acyltransferase
MYHLGVVKCLFENGLLPTVICGASIGALISALVGVHTDEGLTNFFKSKNAVNLSVFEKLDKKGSLLRKLKRLLKFGILMDVSKIEELCRANLGNVTFIEAYEKTRRIVNITLTHPAHKGVPTLLNYLTTPNVLMWSAASAACAQPGLYEAVPLLGKDVEGNIVTMFPSPSIDSWTASKSSKKYHDLPTDRLSELFNVNQFIVSQVCSALTPPVCRCFSPLYFHVSCAFQVNPHVLPFLRSVRSTSRFTFLHQATMWCAGEVFHIIRQAADFGYWPE